MSTQNSDLPIKVSSPVAETSAGITEPKKQNRLLSALVSRSTVLTLAALLLILYFQYRSNGLFITSTNASLLLRQTAVVAIVAAGMTMLIIMGQIDLSVGSAAFLAGLTVAHFQVEGWGLIPSILTAVVVGIVLGLIQGVVITWFAVPAFIVTLAGFLLWRGLGLWLSDATPIGPVTNQLINVTEGRMPMALVYLLALGVVAAAGWQFYSARKDAPQAGFSVAMVVPLVIGVAVAVLLVVLGRTGVGLPNALLWITGVAVLIGGLLGRAKLGRRIYLLGSNAEAAVYAGINAKKIVLIGFLIMGAIYGIAGIMLVSRAGVASPDAGINLELTAIAAAVIGGTSLRGGIGSIRGAILGAFLLATADNGMSLLGVPTYAQNVVKAIILVVAVALDGYFRRRQQSSS